MSNPMNRLQKKKHPPKEKHPQQHHHQQEEEQEQDRNDENIEKRRYKYDMAHAEALRGGTLKTGERPPPTLQSTTTSTSSTTHLRATTSKLEEDATLALQGLEKAESLHKERNDLVGAKRLYELSIGVLIRYLNECTSSSSSSSSSSQRSNNHQLSKDVIAERVRVALTDAEEIKQTLELKEKKQSQKQQQKKQSSWSSLSQSLSHAITGSKEMEQETAPTSSSRNVSENNSQPAASSRSPTQRKKQMSGNNNGTSSYQKQTQASRQRQTQKQNQQPAAKTDKRTTKTNTQPRPTTTKPKPKPSANLPPQLIETIKQDFYVPSNNLSTTWNDISGLQTAKRSIQEAAILPLLRPDLYTGLRSPPRGILLYGPPGTGKTMLVKAAAKESDCLLFAASASVLTSKWHGEGEKLVRALFAFARDVSPAMIFLDEIDAILSSRNENEHEASRRMKTEFMIQMDGITKQQQQQQSEDDVQHQVLVLGCTNCPWDIDDAIMRRFTRRIYVPLPDEDARRTLITHMLNKVDHSLTKRQIEVLVRATDGYSCSDIASIGNEAAFGPLRSIGDLDVIKDVEKDKVRPMNMDDFRDAMGCCKKSVTTGLLERYDKWEKELSGH